MRILIVEDSQRLRDSLSDGLRSAGYAVDAVGDGRQGLIYARATDYDLIILDMMLPVMDGLTVLNEYRSAHGQSPVLILSARDRVEHRVEGLRGGADDYLVKPFDFDELLARVEALCRRAKGREANTIEIRGVTLDLASQTIRYEDEELVLAPREFSMLRYLMINAGRTISRMELEEHVYDSNRQVWSNAVDSSIAAIRRVLREARAPNLIRTRRGMGYQIDTEQLKESAPR
ncbi:MAG: response regulator transcription factor [Phycisphaeraceae bacterium]|nr:response regulator transcription factor [Phycisphaerales bacterium]MCB9843506.1 response regulator transcription factor [Phycisphaeraceae bacterium]